MKMLYNPCCNYNINTKQNSADRYMSAEFLCQADNILFYKAHNYLNSANFAITLWLFELA